MADESGLDLYPSDSGHPSPGFVTPDGKVRLLGCRPPIGRVAAFSPFSAARPLIPESEFVEFDRESDLIDMLDQAQTNSCTGHGTSTAGMFARLWSGMTYRRLSACFLYGLVNGNSDNGAMIGDAVQALVDTGTCLEAEVPEGMIYRRQFLASAFETAKRFRALEVYSVSSWAEATSAAQAGFALSLSVFVAGDFNTDEEGVVPAYAGTGNHCVFMGSRMKKLSNNEWALGGRNSWGTGWGQAGKFFIRKPHIDRQSYFSGLAIRTFCSDPLDPTNPPAVRADLS